MSVVFENSRRNLSRIDTDRSTSLPSSLSFSSPARTHISPLSRTGSSASFSGFRYSLSPRRMTNTVRASNRSAILEVGEELRQLLHAEVPPMIKDRRYHLKVYEKCFIGHDMVDWLIKKGEVESRAEAVAMMQKLLESGVIHHVCDDHDFRDEKLFYRFRRDDGTYEEPPDAIIVAKGQRIYSRLRTDGSNLIQDRKYHLSTFKQCIIGREFVDWLITRGEVNTRDEGVLLGRQLLEAGVFRHVCDDHHFKDEYLYYRFKNDDQSKRQKIFGRSKKRTGSVLSTTGGSDDSISNYSEHRESFGSYEESGENLTSGDSSNTPPDNDDYIHMQSAKEDAYIRMQPSPEPSKFQPPTVQAPQANRRTIAKVTIEELLDPEGQYVERTINVVSDPVGYGFVIRGSRPVYIHTIDPSGPAAAAGLQVGEYLHYVNGQKVLDKSHTDVARIILMGDSTAALVTFIEKDRLAR